jgi:hypothetical protein
MNPTLQFKGLRAMQLTMVGVSVAVIAFANRPRPALKSTRFGGGIKS